MGKNRTDMGITAPGGKFVWVKDAAATQDDVLWRKLKCIRET
jgi:hypothetical protein